jgi:predicted LPLAT superfamily acyltransferase
MEIVLTSCKMRRRSYLVVGTYEDNDQRFAQTFKAFTPEEAEQLAQADVMPGFTLIIAAVLYQGKVVA